VRGSIFFCLCFCGSNCKRRLSFLCPGFLVLLSIQRRQVSFFFYVFFFFHVSFGLCEGYCSSLIFYVLVPTDPRMQIPGTWIFVSQTSDDNGILPVCFGRLFSLLLLWREFCFDGIV